MFVVAVILSILLAVALVVSASGKLTKMPAVVQSMSSVGVPESRLPQLAALEIAGAVGLLIGIFWAPLAIAAAIGVVLYFVGAVGFHVRAHDKGFGPASFLLVVAVITLFTRSASA